MCGSSPEAEAVTRSTGTGLDGSAPASRSALTRPSTACFSAGLVGPILEPAEEAPLYGIGEVADGRLQKYLASEKGCPIKREPSTFPSFSIRLPFARVENPTCAMAVTTSG